MNSRRVFPPAVGLALALIVAATPVAALPDIYPGAPYGEWDYPLVPRDAPISSVHDVRLSPSLPGNTAGTYWNLTVYNWSADPTPDGFVMWLYLDGAENNWDMTYFSGPMPDYSALQRTDQGPRTVRGGRHTLEVRVDEGGYIAESDETNNDWAGQFVWTPYELTQGVPVTRSAPPLRTGGWSSIPAGPTNYYNCDGFRFESVGWWNVVATVPADAADDYDCRLHAPPMLPHDGFSETLAYSMQGAGRVDAVLVNRNTAGQQIWDVGVTNWNAGDGDVDVLWSWSEGLPFGDMATFPVAEGGWVRLYEFQVTPEDLGWVMVRLSSCLGDVLRLRVFGPDFTTGTFIDAEHEAGIVDARAVLHFEVDTPGYYCAAVTKDPIDPGSDCIALLEAGPGRPDFTPVQPVGWDHPCLPRPTPDLAPTVVAAPDTLHGDVASTYINAAVLNDSPVAYLESSPYVKFHAVVDGESRTWRGYHPVPAYDIYEWNSGTPLTVSGGRHTFGVSIDPDREVPELSERNNAYARQWSWAPSTLPAGVAIARPAPAACDGGWYDCSGADPLYFNCDGLRIDDVPGSYWLGLAAGGAAGQDVDIRLHEALPGAVDGFAVPLAVSEWGGPFVDMVLVNFNVASRRPFDVGVIGEGDAGDYAAHAVASVFHGVSPDGLIGPFTLGADELLALHEFQLQPGPHVFRLENMGDDVSLGLSLQHPGLAYQTHSDAVAIAFSAPPGEDQSFIYDLPADAYVCLAVCKDRGDEAPLPVDYRLGVWSGPTDVDDGPTPALRTALAGAAPNPFNPRTTVRFTLAQDGPVRLDVHDLAGKRVRTLVDGRRPAGPHAVDWDGRDNAGSPLASGVYVLRLRAEGVAEVSKVSLVR